MATYIPLSWNDPLFSDNVNSGSVTVPKGGTLSDVSITQTGSIASVVLAGGATLDDIRISSREGVRIGGSGNITINDAWIEATGQSGDHADSIQAYAPGSSGIVTITNTAIVAHDNNATAGMFIADGYTGTFTFNNVMFEGGPYGLRIANDGPGEDYVSLTNVYFVGPFNYGALLFQEVNAPIHITHWENVRYATIENGVLVPGALIPPPLPVEGGGVGSVSINDVTISEGNSGTKVETFTVTRSGGTAAFAVNYATSNGSATVGDNDYAAASGTLNFGANENTKTFSVTINGDTKVEANETFNVGLSNATNGATISDGQGVGTITNDDGAAIAGSVSINDVTISEGNSGTKVETFTVTRSGGTAAFAVNYATSNGSATVGDNDYAAASGTLNFGANENTKTISVTINGDTKVEGNETFNVLLSNATNGATISDGRGVGTITNNDAADTVAPAKPVIASFSTDTGIKGDGITNDHTLSLTGTAEANSMVRVYDGATPLGTATANGSGAWSYTTGILSDAAHSLTASATDAAGNTSVASSVMAVTVDTVAPAKPVIGSFSTDTDTLADRITSDHTLALTGTAEANSAVKLYDGSTLLGTVAANGSGGWSYTTSTLSDATHSFTARAIDAAGNTSLASSVMAVTVVNTPPVATINNHSLDTNEWSQVASWVSYSDADGNPATQYQFWDGGTASNSGYFWTPDNPHHAANTAITVAASDLNSVWLRGGQTGVSETMWVRAFDGTDWSDWDSFTFTTLPNTPPVATINNHSLDTNEWSQVASWVSYSDADGNPATQYQFWDGGTASNSGYFWTPDNPHHAANTAITVAASDLNSVWLRGGQTGVSETMWVRAFDGTDWSVWDQFQLTTIA